MLQYRESNQGMAVVMREIRYQFHTLGAYQTEDDTSFAHDEQVKVIVEPHDFSIAIGKEVLRSSSCAGCTAVVSCEGEVVFYDTDDHVIGRADKDENRYEKFFLKWEQDLITIEFGCTVTVDYYPNCDGEYDRWGKEWQTQRKVTLNLKNKTVEIDNT